MNPWRELAGGGMSRHDRDDLAKIARLNERVARAAASQRKAALLADFEQQLASIYSYDDDETWRALRDSAAQVVEEADRQVAERCRELGIPEKFRPSLNLGWWDRGENASKGRRVELRRVASSRLDAMEKEAIAVIAAKSAEVQVAILSGGLETAQARAFLDSMPTAEALMPPLDAKALAAATGQAGNSLED